MDRSTTWRSILITTCFLLAGINAATINFYCDETVHNAIGGEVIWEVLRSGHDIHLVPHDDKCASNALNKAQSADAFVVLYDSSNLCTVPSKKAQLLVLTYNGTSKMIKSTGDYHNVSDSEDISTFLNGIVVPTSLPSRNSSVKDEKKESETSNEVKLPLWLIVCLGVAIGLLIGGLCIVFMKMRAKRKAAKSSTVSVSKSEKPSKKIKTEKSSTRSTSNSSRKSNSSKSSKSGSSTKSGSSLQCVKVVGSAKGSKSVVTAKPSEMSSDSTAVVVAPSMNRSEKNIDLPVTEETFEAGMNKIIKFAIDYYNQPEQYPVTTAIKPHDIYRALPSSAPENPESFEAVWNDFRNIIFKGLIHWNHPRFFAFFSNGRSYPDILAETLISSLGTVGFSWAGAPAITELDSVIVNWLGRAFGIPESFLFQGATTADSPGGGYLADTGSDTIFCALISARHIKVEELMAKKEKVEENLSERSRHTSKVYGQRNEIISNLVAYGSKESHSSFEKACKMAEVRCRPINTKSKYNYGMTASHLELAIKKDIKRGLIPFYVHVALGTTSTATSDHLKEMGELGKKYGIWIHVDAAYSGNFWVEPKFRANAQGLEHADSLNINLHKQFLVSTSATVFWTRRQHEYKDCFNVSPAYLKRKSGISDLRDWGVQLSRRFKPLKVWFVLRMYGVNGMRAYVNRLVSMAEYMESKICRHPNVRKFGKTNFAMFCVQYIEPDMTEDRINHYTKRFCEFLNESHELLFTHSMVQGHDIIRIAVCMERTTQKDIDESVSIFFRLIEQFKKCRDDENTLAIKKFNEMNNREVLAYDIEQDMILGSPNSCHSSASTTSVASGACDADCNVKNTNVTVEPSMDLIPVPLSLPSLPSQTPPNTTQSSSLNPPITAKDSLIQVISEKPVPVEPIPSVPSVASSSGQQAPPTSGQVPPISDQVAPSTSGQVAPPTSGDQAPPLLVANQIMPPLAPPLLRRDTVSTAPAVTDTTKSAIEVTALTDSSIRSDNPEKK